MKRYLWDYAFLLSVGGLVLALDQFTKILVRSRLDMHEVWNPFGDWLEPYARIIHTTNTGMAFGQFPQFGVLFTVFSVIAILAVLNFFPLISRQDRLTRVAMGMVLGGAAGNLLDRLLIGSVTDFISIGNFAIFNVADSSLSIAAALIIVPNLPSLLEELFASRRRDRIKEIRQRRGLLVLPGRRQAASGGLSLGMVEVLLNLISPASRLALGLRAWRIHRRRARRLDLWRALRLRR